MTLLQDLKTKGDFLAEAKASSKIDPAQKALGINMGTDIMLLLRDTEITKEFLQNPFSFKKAKYFSIFKPLLGESLFFAEGDRWKMRRKLISSSFHYEFITSNTQLVQETVREFLDKIPPSEFKNCLIMDKIQEITGEVVGRTFFGRNLNRYNFEGQPLTLALASLMADIGSIVMSPLYMVLNTKILLLPLPKIIRLKRRIREFRAQCYKIIEDRKKEDQKHHDLLNALLVHQRNETDSTKRLTDEDITNEFITFFMAGMDTTGHLVTMTLYNLAQNPEHLEKLKEEREARYNSTGKEVNVENIQNMNVLGCVIKETLRHHTPAPTVFPREAVEDIKLKDLYIKKGTLVRSDMFALAFDSKYFEEPEKFKPERWQKVDPKLDPYAFIPFSAGPRNCIGQHLATLEAKILVSEFLERFDFKVSEGYKLGMMFRFLYEPYEEMRMDLTKK